MLILPKKELISHASILLATLIWSAASPIMKATLHYMTPITFLFLRFLIVGIVLLPYAWVELKKTKIDPKDYFNLFLLGIFSQTSILLLAFALKYTTALDTILISILGSILAIYFGHYFFKDKLDTKLTIGLILASLGSLIVMVEPIFSQLHTNEISTTQRIFGNILAILYNVSWAFYITFSKMTMGKETPVLRKTLKFINLKPMTKPYSASMIVTITMYVGLITMIIPAFIENYINPAIISKINLYGVLGLLYMALMSSVVAYMTYQWSLKHLKVSEAAIYGYLSPVLALPFAYILLREIPNVYMIIGSIFIAVGVIIAEAKNS